MPIFEHGVIVRVPFPYTDRPIKQHRPALVVSRRGLGEGQRLLWVLMITSAENRRWPGDVEIGERYAAMGLPAPSVIRTSKIATVEGVHADGIGQLDDGPLNRVLAELNATLRGHQR